MSGRRRWPRWLLSAPLLAVALPLACGGGGGRGGGGGGGGPTVPPTPTATPVAIGFTATGTGGVNSLALTRISSDADSIVLSLEATSVTDLYGVAFDLVYPADLLVLDDVEEGGFLSQSGAVQTSMQVAETPRGTIIVGLSRLGQVSGRTGSGSVLSLSFERSAAGQGDLRFEDNQAFDSVGAAISGVTWSAGRVTVP